MAAHKVKIDRSNKENNTIYHDLIPAAHDLPPLQRALLVKATPVARDAAWTPLFSKVRVLPSHTEREGEWEGATGRQPDACTWSSALCHTYKSLADFGHFTLCLSMRMLVPPCVWSCSWCRRRW
jgi:hypothetical protein